MRDPYREPPFAVDIDALTRWNRANARSRREYTRLPIWSGSTCETCGSRSTNTPCPDCKKDLT